MPEKVTAVPERHTWEHQRLPGAGELRAEFRRVGVSVGEMEDGEWRETMAGGGVACLQGQ